MSIQSSTDVVRNFLAAMGAGTFSDEYIDENIEYVSLNQSNPELAEIMPWAGTHHGRPRFKEFFTKMLEAWDFLEFQVDTLFGEGDQVAVFGRFVYQSKLVKNITRSPFAIYAKVRDGRIHYFQFFEDTYDTAASFRQSGHWSIENAWGARTVGT